MVLTVTRVPRMQAFPLMTAGSTVIRCKFLIFKPGVAWMSNVTPSQKIAGQVGET